MDNLPKHVAIIMDGNGRWATRRMLPRIAGHRQGAKVVKEIVETAAKRGIEVLTLFAFSLENRRRPGSEVKFLMGLLLDSLERNTKKMHENNIRLRVIGERSYFDKKLLKQIEASEELTRDNTGMTLVIAINYSGRWDILQAAKKIAADVEQQKISADEIDFERYGKGLCLADLPEPDLLIRTSGEQRISNFMLWQFAYTDIFFTPVMWPDFNTKVFDEGLAFFQTRQRRFGLTSQQIEAKYA